MAGEKVLFEVSFDHKTSPLGSEEEAQPAKLQWKFASNSRRNWILVLKMHHVRVYRHEISPWKVGGSTLQLEAIYWLCYAEASKIAAFVKLHMQQSRHNSGSFIPAANVLSCHPFDIYLTSKVCVSSVTLFCKPDKTWFCILYEIKNITHTQFPLKPVLCFALFLKGVVTFHPESERVHLQGLSTVSIKAQQKSLTQ